MIVSLLFVLCPGLLPAGRCRSPVRPDAGGEGRRRERGAGARCRRALSCAAPSRSPRSRGGNRADPRRPRPRCLAPPGPALLLLLADGRGVRLLLPPRHHLDQHPRVSEPERADPGGASSEPGGCFGRDPAPGSAVAGKTGRGSEGGEDGEGKIKHHNPSPPCRNGEGRKGCLFSRSLLLLLPPLPRFPPSRPGASREGLPTGMEPMAPHSPNTPAFPKPVSSGRCSAKPAGCFLL